MREYWRSHCDEITRRLTDEFDYTLAEADHTLRRIAEAAPEIQDAAIAWLESGTLEGPAVEGYSAATLVEAGRSKSPLAAFLTIDWLLRDREAALESLRRPLDVLRPPGRS